MLNKGYCILLRLCYNKIVVKSGSKWLNGPSFEQEVGKLLIGEYGHSLDEKSRVNFPARLREGLGSRFIITKGLDECLFVYSEEEWKVLEDRIRTLPLSKGRNLQRFFFSGAIDVEPDKQGRVVIPANLREYAGIAKDVMIVGASVRAEIWDRDRWLANRGEMTSDMVAEAMDELGF
jgi:MraZ protein